ncbi:ATP-binding protein [Kitasatospora sp. NPDC098652]|uniref:sensor histidine kinase n=1 Tax=Kitasatospora sp. NPDC098652 TaxID=3364095 RepID=UPI003809D535
MRAVPAWWARRSLRARLTTAAAVVIAAGLAAAALVLTGWLHNSLIGGLDETALQRAQLIAAAVDRQPLDQAIPASAEAEGTAIQIIDSSGAVRASSGNIQDEPRLFTFPAPDHGHAPARTVHGVPIGDESAYRALALAAGTPPDRVAVYVALSTAGVDRSLAVLDAGLAIGAPLLLAVLTGTCWALTGHALRPVETLRRQAEQITTAHLDQRLAVPPSRDEVARLAETLNDLLTRLDTSISRQRQFIADAAHELRNPLSTLKTELETATRRPGSTHWATTLPDLLAETTRLSALVDDLVQLARLDAHPALRRTPMDLDDIVYAEVRRLRTRSPLTIDQHQVTPARMIGDRHALGRLVRNLLDNAARHATNRIDVTLHVRAGTAELTVADDGRGIPPGDRERVFDRFTRLDDARGRDRGGVGLGLAIVRDIATAHGGSAEVRDNTPGAKFIIRLPADRT